MLRQRKINLGPCLGLKVNENCAPELNINEKPSESSSGAESQWKSTRIKLQSWISVNILSPRAAGVDFIGPGGPRSIFWCPTTLRYTTLHYTTLHTLHTYTHQNNLHRCMSKHVLPPCACFSNMSDMSNAWQCYITTTAMSKHIYCFLW